MEIKSFTVRAQAEEGRQLLTGREEYQIIKYNVPSIHAIPPNA